MSELTPVTVAVSRVMKDMDPVAKKGVTSEKGQWRYRKIDDVMTALQPVLAEHGVVVAPHKLLSATTEAVQVGAKIRWTSRVHVKYRVYGPDGNYLSFESFGEGFDYADKSPGKAMAYALKTGVSQFFMIAFDDPSIDNEAHDHGQTPAVPPHPKWKGPPISDTEAAQIVAAFDEIDEPDRRRAKIEWSQGRNPDGSPNLTHAGHSYSWGDPSAIPAALFGEAWAAVRAWLVECGGEPFGAETTLTERIIRVLEGGTKLDIAGIISALDADESRATVEGALMALGEDGVIAQDGLDSWYIVADPESEPLVDVQALTAGKVLVIHLLGGKTMSYDELYAAVEAAPGTLDAVDTISFVEALIEDGKLDEVFGENGDVSYRAATS